MCQEDNCWWVYMLVCDMCDDVDCKVVEFKCCNVVDLVIVQEGNMFVVLLGLFCDKECVQQCLDELCVKDVCIVVVM